MAVTTAARLYYLFSTFDQPVWWDEAEYLVKAKSLALGTSDTGVWVGRPPLLPIAMAPIFAVGLGEGTIRVLLALASQVSVYLTYRVGRRAFGELAGIVGAWLFGLFYLQLFFTMRVMTEIPQLVLVLLGMAQLLQDSGYARVRTAIALALAVFIRYPAAVMFIVVGAHILNTEGLSALRNRWNYIAAGAAALITCPFLVGAYVSYGDPYQSLKAPRFLMPAMDLSRRWRGLLWYWNWARGSLDLVTGGLVACGVLASAVCAVTRRDTANTSVMRGADFFMLVWLIVPIAFFGLFVSGLQDRYLLLSLPPAFLLAGRVVTVTAGWVERETRVPVGVFVMGVLIASGVPLLATADAAVRSRTDSYVELRDAARWLSPRLSPDSVVSSKSVAQLTYYTSHAVIALPTTRADFDATRASGQIDYIVVTRFEPQPSWLTSGPFESLGLREVATFPDIGDPMVVVLAPEGPGTPAR